MCVCVYIFFFQRWRAQRTFRWCIIPEVQDRINKEWLFLSGDHPLMWTTGNQLLPSLSSQSGGGVHVPTPPPLPAVGPCLPACKSPAAARGPSPPGWSPLPCAPTWHLCSSCHVGWVRLLVDDPSQGGGLTLPESSLCSSFISSLLNVDILIPGIAASPSGLLTFFSWLPFSLSWTPHSPNPSAWACLYFLNSST